MRRLGSKAGTQNIDRILRLPGTTNLPNAKKRKEGRVACQTRLLWFDDVSYPLDAFPKEEPGKKKPGKKKPAGRQADALAQAISESVPKGERSEAVWFVINEMLRRGYRAEAIVQVLLDRNNGVSEHIYDQSKPHEYAARQVEQATEKIEFVCRRERQDTAHRRQHPDRTAQARRERALRSVRGPLAARRAARVRPGAGGCGGQSSLAAIHGTPAVLSEPGAGAHRHKRYGAAQWLSSGARLSRQPCSGTAKPRVDQWLVTYAGAEDSNYTRAVGALVLIAAVRRVRQPGCKFDEMLVLEQPQQGTDKSSALAVLAVNEDWFTDDLPLNVEAKRVIETLRGRWIVEAAELSGMRKADVEHLKAMLSRRVDRARMAYGRLPIEAPRQCIIVGTTNKGGISARHHRQPALLAGAGRAVRSRRPAARPRSALGGGRSARSKGREHPAGARAVAGGGEGAAATPCR